MKFNFTKIIPALILLITGCEPGTTSGTLDLLVTGNSHAQFDPCG